MTLVIADLRRNRLYADKYVGTVEGSWARASKIVVTKAGIFAGTGGWNQCVQVLAEIKSLGSRVLDAQGRLRGSFPDGDWELLGFIGSDRGGVLPYNITHAGAAPICVRSSPRYVGIGSAHIYARGFIDGFTNADEDDELCMDVLFRSASDTVIGVSAEYECFEFGPNGTSEQLNTGWVTLPTS